MFQVERLQKIREILLDRNSISVLELSDILDVSEITVRRDFEKLEKDGFIQRTHGGAVLSEQQAMNEAAFPSLKSNGTYFPDLQVSPANADLGNLCADIVEDYDILFLGRTPSNIVLASQLAKKRDVVVVTNSIEVMLAMCADKTNQVILTGGKMDFDRWMVRPGLDILPVTKINKAFLHVQGLDYEGGVTFNDQDDARLYEMLKECTTGDIVLVAEGILFGRVGLYHADSLDQVTVVVTDNRMPNEYKAQMYQQGTKIYQKFEL